MRRTNTVAFLYFFFLSFYHLFLIFCSFFVFPHICFRFFPIFFWVLHFFFFFSRDCLLLFFFWFFIFLCVFFQNYLCRFFFNIELVKNLVLWFFSLKYYGLLQCFPTRFFLWIFFFKMVFVDFFFYWVG
jgi:hypothetical protein